MLPTIRIVTDSSTDIPQALIDELAIEIVPIKINIDGDFIPDTNLELDKFYKDLRTSENLPTTSQPAPADFQTAFERIRTEGAEQILCITLAAVLSGTYQSAVIGASMVEDKEFPIEVVDSQKASYATGMMVVAVARAVREGKSLAECMKIIRNYRDNSYVFFIVESLDFMAKGGRIGKAAGLVGSLLNIIPILSLTEMGEVFPADKVRGQNRAFQRLLELMSDKVPPGREISLAVMHADNLDGTAKWMREISAIYDVKESIIHSLSPVVGTHTGPGTVACAICDLTEKE